MQLFIRRITGSVVIVEVDLATTIREMKAMIERKYDIPADTIRLVLAGNIIKDHETVMSLGLMRESPMTMLVSKDAPSSTPSYGPPMTLQFKLQNGTMIVLEVGQTEPFSSIKAKVAAKAGVKPEEVHRILHAGNGLVDTDTPASVGDLGMGTCLHVIIRAATSTPTPTPVTPTPVSPPVSYGPTTPINFKLTTGSTIAVECGQREPFSRIKARIAEKAGLRPEEVNRIVHAGTAVLDTDTPSSIGDLSSGTCLHAIIRSVTTTSTPIPTTPTPTPPPVVTSPTVSYGPTIPINFKLTSGNVISVECGQREPFASIKAKIARQAGVRPEDITRILHAGTAVLDSDTPASIGGDVLSGASCLHAIIRATPTPTTPIVTSPVSYGPSVTIQFKVTASGNMFAVECGMREPFSSIKAKLAAQARVSADKVQRILHAGTMVADTDTPESLSAGDASLLASSCLHCVIRA